MPIVALAHPATLAALALLPGLFINGYLAAAGLGAVSIPIAIHLLTRLRRQQQPWAAMRFLIEAFRRQRQRLRLEQFLLLLLRCLALIVLGLALAGPFLGGLARGLGADGAGRLVCIVIDDALSSQASAGGSRDRFEDLRRTAATILERLRPGDRVAIWTTARPLATPLSPPTPDLAQARLVLDGLRPRFSRSDWPAALAAVQATLAEQALDRQRAWVVLLSDFSAGAIDLDRPAPASLAGLGSKALISVVRPAPQAGNYQIAALTPGRGLILADNLGPAAVPLELRLRRFGAEPIATASAVRVELLGDDPTKPLASANQEFRWAPGQASASLNIDLLLPPNLAAGAPGPEASPAPTTAPAPGTPGAATAPAPPRPAANTAGQTLQVRATLEPAAADALAADNRRTTLVELRRRLHVGILDEPAAAPPGSPGAAVLRPHDWLAIALAPQSPRRGPAGLDTARPIEIHDLAPAALEPQALARLDAVMLLRPDLLTAQGWTTLRDFVRRGGLLWVFAPSLDAPAIWTQPFRETMGVDWTIGLNPRAPGTAPGTTPGSIRGNGARAATATAPGPAASAPAPSPTSASTPAWALDADAPAPEPLRLLSADWAAVLRPVQVLRRLDLSARSGQEAVWLRVVDPSPDAGSALLTWASVGEGRVVFLATALDPAWTNLMTKPLFLPLLHETLRSALGASSESARRGNTLAGDQPLLGARWDAVQELRRLDAPGAAPLPLRRSDAGISPAAPLQDPGVYVASPTPALRLAVNPDPDAGNTAALDPAALGQWLGTLGDWSWLDTEAPEKALAAESLRTELGWPLLWLGLALLLLETWMARHFSHASLAAGALAPVGRSDPDAPVATGASAPAPATSDAEAPA